MTRTPMSLKHDNQGARHRINSSWQ